MTYKYLYHLLFAAIDDALTLLERGETRKAARLLQTRLTQAEEEHLKYDMLPDKGEEKVDF